MINARHNKRIDRSRLRYPVVPMPYNGFSLLDGSVILHDYEVRGLASRVGFILLIGFLVVSSI